MATQISLPSPTQSLPWLPKDVFGPIFDQLFADIAYQDDEIVKYILLFGPDFQEEATKAVKRLHAPGTQVTVTVKSQRELCTQRLKELMKIKKLNLIYPADRSVDGSLNLRANKLNLLNNIQVIEINALEFSSISDQKSYDSVSMILLRASRSQLKRIIIKLAAFPGSEMNSPPQGAWDGGFIIDPLRDITPIDNIAEAVKYTMITHINHNLDTPGRLMRVVPYGVVETWFWQGENGQPLTMDRGLTGCQ